MENIVMVDLRRQYAKIKKDIDPIWQNILENTCFIQGQIVKDFAESFAKYLSVNHVIPCGNGTDALQASLMALELKEGDEVITPSFTFVATVEAIAVLKLKPVLVDVCPNTFNIDPKAVEKAITPKTKAIIPVHLFGQCANMEEVLDIAKRHNLYVIEDSCQASGADYIWNANTPNERRQKAGTIGDIGCTSFFPSKNLGCFGDGGAIFTNDDTLAKKLRYVVNHGMEVRYHHDHIGLNSRLDSLQAAVLYAKLPHLDEYNKERKNLADFYNSTFEVLEKNNYLRCPKGSVYSTHIYHQYTMVLGEGVDRNKLKEYLSLKGIPSMVYYPIPLHMQKAYLDERYKEGDFPVSEMLAKRVLSLPMHTEMDEEQRNYIAKALLDYFGA